MQAFDLVSKRPLSKEDVAERIAQGNLKGIPHMEFAGNIVDYYGNVCPQLKPKSR